MSGIGGSGNGVTGYGYGSPALSRIVEHLQSKGVNVVMHGNESLNTNNISSQTVAGVGTSQPSFESFLKA